MRDPIGPGTTAWKCFDLALDAPKGGPRNKSSAQYRALMRYHLKRQGASQATIDAWTRDLDTRRFNGEPSD